MKKANASRAGTGRVSAAKTERKIATAKDRLGKETVASGLCDFLPATTIDGGIIAKQEKG